MISVSNVSAVVSNVSNVLSFHLSGFAVFHFPVDEKALDGRHLVVKCRLHNNNKDISVNTLVDCGATGISFIDEEYARQHNFPLF